MRTWPRDVERAAQQRLFTESLLSASSTKSPLTMSLTDPLTLLRDYTMQKKPITLEGDVYVADTDQSCLHLV